MLWNSATGQVSTVATPAIENGQRIQGSAVSPSIADGRAAWVQRNAQGTNDIHLLDLATGKNSIIASGQVGAPVFMGEHLVWITATSVQAPMTIHFANALTGRAESLPAALKGVSGVAGLAASPDALAWASRDLHSLFLWHPGDAQAQKIVTVVGADAVQFPSLAGPLVSWRGVQGVMVADTRSHAFVQVNPEYGFQIASDNELVVVSPATSAKMTHPPGIVQVVNVNDLPPLPGCS